MRQSRAILVEYVQEMQADLFNLTSISKKNKLYKQFLHCRLYTSPSPRDRTRSRMPSSA